MIDGETHELSEGEFSSRLGVLVSHSKRLEGRVVDQGNRPLSSAQQSLNQFVSGVRSFNISQRTFSLNEKFKLLVSYEKMYQNLDPQYKMIHKPPIGA